MKSHKDKSTEKGQRPILVLAGNPNVGKSVLFGLLTGRYANVSNYPGTTVEVSRGPAKIKGHEYSIVDSPGVNSLTPTSEDEKVTRDILLNEDVNSVINVLDAKNLRRGLLVSIQLSEMELNSVLALNMYDEAGEKGSVIDTDLLSRLTGCHVTPTIATQRWGFDKLKDAAATATASTLKVTYPEKIEDAIEKVITFLPDVRISKRSLALMLLSGDETLNGWVKENLKEDVSRVIFGITKKLSDHYGESVAYIINRERLRLVDAIVKQTVTVEPKKRGPITELLGRYSMHPVWGLFVLAFVLFIMYEFVGVFGAGYSVDFLETHVFEKFINPWAERVSSALLPEGILRDLFVGEYGLVTMALTYAVAIVLPIVGYFFIFFSFLEDSGYLPRLAVMVDRVFKRMGLNGKSVLPMILGLGCDTMATMTTRILETKKERIIVTLLLALGIPCSAQLGVILGMLGGVGLLATLIWVVTVLITLFVVAALSSKIVPGDTSDFILEIPPIRMPKISNILLKTMVRVEWYLKEAVPLFILGTLVLFVLDRIHMLKVIERVTTPLFVGLLDLPAKSAEAFLIGFLRRDYGAAGLFNLQRDGLMDGTQVVVALVTMTLFVPCIANFFMIIKERGAKAALYMALFIFPFAILVGTVLNFVLRTLNVAL